MTIVRRPSPFGELLSLRQAMDKLFDDDSIRPLSWTTAPTGPAIPLDLVTTSDALIVRAALPGVSPEDVEITVENGTLTIAGSTIEAKDVEEGSELLREIPRGSFSRSVSLPNGLEPDRADAKFEHGILSLRIPKAEQLKPRPIRISTVTDGRAGRKPDDGRPSDVPARS